MTRPAHRLSPRAFVLFDAMLGVLIFSIGVIGLGYSVTRCLEAHAAIDEMDRARLALENRLSAIIGRAAPAEEPAPLKLEGAFDGMTLITEAEPVEAEDEKKNPILGIRSVRLRVEWPGPARSKQSREIEVYVLRN